MTESATTVCSTPADETIGKIGSTGSLVPGISAKVLKEDGTFGNEGEQGELLIQGPSIALGYLNNEKA
jgi:4-coumarate--CoA ligase